MAGKPRKRHPVTQPLDASYRLIPLTRNQNAIVDAEDFDWLNKVPWFAVWSPCTQSFYASRCVKRITLGMHRVILGCEAGEETDHKNHNTLDNRRKNLRKCTRAQNIYNRRIHKDNKSGFKGVSWMKSVGKWRAMVGYEYLGVFDSPEEAARVYDRAAKIHHGQFASLNFP